VHSRVEETIDFIVEHAHVGNIYVNRNMIGAVVGVQPFGGEGKSGTGPKAGGPLYLRRLLPQLPISFTSLGGTPAREAPAALRVLRDWALRTGRRALADLCEEYATLTPLVYSIALPGPTGESNTLAFAPRGWVVCIADDETALLSQIAAALATGNQVLLPGDRRSLTLVDMLPSSVREQLQVQADWRHAPIAAVLYAGPTDDAYRLRNELAEREGALVPLITDGPGRNFPLYRLTAEHVISVNTAAAGGNASLMTLGS
jgi:RHH-type proline utilization regulon transcriptional repressor/proline dehydrogenase/delta 1-pyrroline-5-carboxylate dehydrogenase